MNFGYVDTFGGLAPPPPPPCQKLAMITCIFITSFLIHHNYLPYQPPVSLLLLNLCIYRVQILERNCDQIARTLYILPSFFGE